MEKPFSKIKPIKKILFLHGFTSGGDCEIARTLSEVIERDGKRMPRFKEIIKKDV